MMTLAGVSQSFRYGCSLLSQLAGWTTSHEVLRQVCYRQSDQLAPRRDGEDCPEIQPFVQATGQIEFQTDATKLNTLGGWRDMKIGVFAKREPVAAVAPEDWDRRRLPAPTARLAFAAIEEIETFAPRWWPWSQRLGLEEDRLSVLGDGAEWIWDHVELHFPNSQGVLDIYHAGEWLGQGAKAGCGEGTPEASRWLEEARLALLRDGYLGLCEYARESSEWVPSAEGLAEALGPILNYFCGHRDRVNYVLRLRQGLPIGSGLIEGACKQVIGRRMKQTGAQWDVANANRMAQLCCLAHADSLTLYFNAA